MYILGISELDNDVGATLFKNGEIIGAANEERFTRKKRQAGVPELSIKFLLDREKISFKDLKKIIIVKPDWGKEFRITYKSIFKYNWLKISDLGICIRIYTLIGYLFYLIPVHSFKNFLFDRQLNKYFKLFKIPKNIIFRSDHHRSHAACVFYTSGWEKGLYITIDGQGMGTTASVHIGSNGKLKCIERIKLPHSIGFFYAGATKALGFRIGKHEGKVTGLAAYGTPNKDCVEFFRKLISFRESTLLAPDVIGSYPIMLKLLKKSGKKDFAASVQFVFEEVIKDFINYWVNKTGINKVGLAGGVFGNVKLNQKIHELKSISEIFIFPNMSDGGLAFGACLDQFPYESRPIKNIYLGPDYSDYEMKTSILKNHLDYLTPQNAPKKIASLLNDGKVVARFGGRMEFGPRALGNRSILYRPDIPEVNNWLNKNLKRTEFMPFAPVTMWEHAKECYLGIEGAERTAEYMTITFECTEKMKINSSGVVHIDGTARPQLIKREVNSFYYDIIKYFYELSGIPSLVNTSFNMHEEPIVCNPDEAIKAFQQSKIDVLSLGPYLIFN